ncbi:hypothetical protein, partial [Salmonella sp. s55004]|uniref:hypothetical protein n=1 Tax=Salmonella sp. s55004 TaxID=3159675 RepID=UPI0039809D9A
VGLAVVASVSTPCVDEASVKSAEEPDQRKGTTLDVVAVSRLVTKYRNREEDTDFTLYEQGCT